MDLRAELEALAQHPGRDRRQCYAALLGSSVYVRAPGPRLHLVTNPETGRRAVPAFLSTDEARAFWAQVTPGAPVALEEITFVALAGQARELGDVVIDPAEVNLVLTRAEVMQLAAGEIPGEFAAWMRQLDRLGRRPEEVMSRLRRAYVHVITGKGSGDEQRLYLLEKSEDGTLAVPCFTSRETLTQFAEVRRLFEGYHDHAVALVEGAHCLRVASGMGAYILVDPESPWETQVEPSLP